MSEPGIPLPVADADTLQFWDATQERRLVVPRCRACQKWIWQPKPVCPRCGADEPAWTGVSGRGRVASWTVIHPPVLPVWQERVPFTVLLVELDEGVRMIGQLIGDGAGLAMNAPVTLAWQEEGDLLLPAWALAS